MPEIFVTVSQINNYLKNIVVNDINLKGLVVKGEISNFTDHARLGHYYFTLKDDKAAVKSVMFKWNKAKIKFKPENGMKVIVTADVNVFERDGIFQLVVTDMQPDGIGDLHLAFEQLKQKLGDEGLFDNSHKKKIPVIPKRIGVITAAKGAALQDIINILTRRYPLVTLVVFDSLVQGSAAPESLCRALDKCAESGVDTVIIGRGGGSLEDLWAFNDEHLARKIYDFGIPIISAVGHETDFSISDFVADLRAPTPSAAAELAVPNITELTKYIDSKIKAMSAALTGKFQAYSLYYSKLDSKIAAQNPENKINSYLSELENYKIRLKNCVNNNYVNSHKILSELMSKIDVLSPLNTLTRGFSLTMNDKGSIIYKSEDVSVGDKIISKLSAGEIESSVIKIKGEKSNG